MVVAGRFWCSYAWVSLTPTTPARPRAPVFCTRARARARYRARACACARLERVRARAFYTACVQARFFYARAGVPVGVPVGGVAWCGAWWWWRCGVVWCLVVVAVWRGWRCGVRCGVAYLFSF